VKHSFEIGLGFGSTSGIITTLGLMVGLHSYTGSKLIILGGVLTIAIADAFSDAFGIHISEESEKKHTPRQIWEASFFTFLFKLIFASTFIIPIMFFEISAAIFFSTIWGMLLLTILSYRMAVNQKESPLKVIGEHIIVAVLVIIVTHYVGDWIAITFA
jgi:VIT1/CCC1 family predicted Fe2+/Mn2+ transporter